MLGGFSWEGLGIYHPHRLLYWVEGFQLIVGIELIEGFELFNEVGPVVAPVMSTPFWRRRFFIYFVGMPEACSKSRDAVMEMDAARPVARERADISSKDISGGWDWDWDWNSGWDWSGSGHPSSPLKKVSKGMLLILSGNTPVSHIMSTTLFMLPALMARCEEG